MQQGAYAATSAAVSGEGLHGKASKWHAVMRD